jgi:hypothetical protein
MSARWRAQQKGERTMKFMMLMIPAVYRDNKKVDPNFSPDPQMIEKMGRYNEELGKVFKVTDLNGLQPLSAGARVSFTNGKATVTDGPSIEAREVLGGYWLLEAPSKEEVVKWAQKCPAQDGDLIEVRQIFEFEPK